MTLELYYNTEHGAVIDRNEDTRCIAICITIGVFHIAIYLNTPVAPQAIIGLENQFSVFFESGRFTQALLYRERIYLIEHPNFSFSLMHIRVHFQDCTQ